MKSGYIENFNGIRASEEAKQKTINMLINYVNGETVKSQKRFVWSNKRIIAAASTAAILIFCAILIPAILGPYSGGKQKAIKDYYEEYSFELPFKHTVGNNQYTTLYFDTELTMEQMCESIEESGNQANLHDNDNIKKIFITATKNGFAYYFVIYDKSYLEPIHGSDSVYTLSACSASLNMTINPDVKEPHIYVFLFPLHFSGITADNPSIVKIYCTFDEFADFYKATGRNDAQIDYDNMSVTFFCEGNANQNWIRGNILMRYIESGSGNYISIQPQQ